MLHHGQRITKKEIELTTSLWPPDEFASLCNAITWASAQRQEAILPSFTERVSVKDQGIDAEYVTLGAQVGASSSLLSAGGNVLQYKLRDILAQNRSKIVSDLKQEFKLFTGNKRADGTKDYYGILLCETNIPQNCPSSRGFSLSLNRASGVHNSGPSVVNLRYSTGQ